MTADQFWERVEPEPNSGCWLWTGPFVLGGYGTFSVSSRRMVGAHRFAYAEVYGPIPEGMLVCHRCDVKPCVNPDHLFLGTQRDNMQDMVRKGRNWQSLVTHCPHGHEYNEANTRLYRGHRYCAVCERERAVARWAAQKEAA